MSSHCVANDSASPRRLPWRCFRNILAQHYTVSFRWGGGEGRFLVGTIKKSKCHEKTHWTWESYLFRSRNNIWKNNLHKGGRVWPSKSVPLPIKEQLWFFIPRINKYPSPEKSEGLCNQPIMNPLAFLNAKKISIYWKPLSTFLGSLYGKRDPYYSTIPFPYLESGFENGTVAAIMGIVWGPMSLGVPLK